MTSKLYCAVLADRLKSVHSFISYFSCCCAKFPDKSSFRKDVCIQAHVGGRSPPWQGRHDCRSVSRWSHFTDSRGQSDERWCSAFFLTLSSPSLQPMGWCYPELGWVLPLELTKFRNFLTDMPKGFSLCDSRFCQLDSSNEPSQFCP